MSDQATDTKVTFSVMSEEEIANPGSDVVASFATLDEAADFVRTKKTEQAEQEVRDYMDKWIKNHRDFAYQVTEQASTTGTVLVPLRIDLIESDKCKCGACLNGKILWRTVTFLDPNR